MGGANYLTPEYNFVYSDRDGLYKCIAPGMLCTRHCNYACLYALVWESHGARPNPLGGQRQVVFANP